MMARAASHEPTISLQQELVYGPVRSRRFGLSLGLNLLPSEIKVCPMDCLYCQYSWTGMHTLDGSIIKSYLPKRENIVKALGDRLVQLAKAGKSPDTITFSGNGEPTLHPDFAKLVKDVISLRDELAPSCRTAVLSNSTTVGSPAIREALLQTEEPVMKLDAGREETFKALNRPTREVAWHEILAGLRAMGSRAVIQAMFVRGRVDNSADAEVRAWAEQVRRIGPRAVQIYTLDRGPADIGLSPVTAERLRLIAGMLKTVAGISPAVFE